MNYKFKSSSITILYLISALIAILLYNLQLFKVEIFGTILILLTTIYFSLKSYFLEYDKFFKELFIGFNNRYNEINENLNSITNATQLNDNEKKTVIDYFNICAEEYMWNKRGRIPLGVYLSWEEDLYFI
ncbi:MAG: hypothetical protein IPP32_16675 [Bacteroidetes bacterium]|nr:hypothetical protein [Bacteroidota bacterium]